LKRPNVDDARHAIRTSSLMCATIGVVIGILMDIFITDGALEIVFAMGLGGLCLGFIFGLIIAIPLLFF
jgi:hypothetical protein